MIELLLPLLASLLARTLRIRVTGDAIPERAVVMFWHGKMFAGWYAARKLGSVALVSKSKDGRLLSAVLERWGYRLVRGSSGKGGMEALMEAVAMIRDGAARTLVITPDGPRGPRQSLKRGAFVAATELTVPLVMLSVRYHRAHTFSRSWDRFELPMPFSRVDLVARRLDIGGYPTEKSEAQTAYLDFHSKRLAD